MLERPEKAYKYWRDELEIEEFDSDAYGKVESKQSYEKLKSVMLDYYVLADGFISCGVLAKNDGCAAESAYFLERASYAMQQIAKIGKKLKEEWPEYV